MHMQIYSVTIYRYELTASVNIFSEGRNIKLYRVEHQNNWISDYYLLLHRY